MYKKLFPIDFNNKTFMIFIDENKKYTFLELDTKGIYHYPFIEDYLSLYKIYNLHHPFIYFAQYYQFTPKTRLLSGATVFILAVTTLLNNIGIASAKEIKTTINNDSLVIEEIADKESLTKTIEITDLKDLDKYLGPVTITKELVKETIANNPNLSSKYKKIANRLLDEITSLHPDFNLRIFYENIKTLEIREYTVEEFRALFSFAPGGGANYDAELNCITAIDKIPIELLYHEMFHVFTYFYREIDNTIITRNSNSVALSEAATNNASSLAYPIKHTYEFEGLVYDYFTNLVDYTISDFNNHQISLLLTIIKAQYPTIDVDYIECVLDTMTKNLIYQGKQTPIDNCEGLLDEIFKICLQEAHKSPGYEPFNNYAKLFRNAINPELVFEYYEKYNKYLTSIGFSKIIPVTEVKEKYQPYKDATGLRFEGDYFYPISYTDNVMYEISDIGSKTETSSHQFFSTFNFPSLMTSTIFSYYNTFATNDYWHQITKEAGLISPHAYTKIPIYYNEKLLSVSLVSDLFVSVGNTTDGKIGYRLKDHDGNILFESDKDLINESSSISLSYYLIDFSEYIKELNLEDIFNEEYLLKLTRYTSPFTNVEIEENQLTIFPKYLLQVQIGDVINTYSMGNIKVSIKSGILKLTNDSDLNLDFYCPDYESIEFANMRFQDFLKSCDILNPDTLTYKYDQSSLISVLEMGLMSIENSRTV